MKTLEINCAENLASKIIIEKGQVQKLSFDDKKYFLITNTTLARLYPEMLQKFRKDRVIIIKDGEKYKNFKTYEYVINELLGRKIERQDTIVALGGGVVGDISGFAASSVLRGVKLIQIPTTLLAMTDSALGGKTGINTKFGKNLLGSFYMASFVLIDPDFLKTLSEYEFRCGLGEVVKYAFIEKSCRCDIDFNLIEYLEKHDFEELRNNSEYIIEASCALKANVVEQDRCEKGLRAILNLGHTYAHAFETLSKYKGLSHGEAVALGIKCAAKFAYAKEKIDKTYFDKINNIVDKFNLADKKPEHKPRDIINLMYHDKKVKNGEINLLVPSGIAQVEQVCNIQEHELEASLI